MDGRVGVIDLGSNTFHLLISEYDPTSGELSQVLKKRLFIYLAKGGQDVLSDEAIERGKKGVLELSKICECNSVKAIYLIGTSALRLASNADVFCNWVKENLGLSVEVISGQKEAMLIYKGITLSQLPLGQNLVMDIGGGSVEFIFERDGELIGTYSLPIGISALRGQFSISDTPTEKEISQLRYHLDKAMKDLLLQNKDFNPTFLIGSSGPFEIIESYMGLDANPKGNVISRKLLSSCIEEIKSSTLSQRLALPYMPATRADLSKESMLLMEYVLDTFRSIEQLFVSPYALKEGVLKDKLNLG